MGPDPQHTMPIADPTTTRPVGTGVRAPPDRQRRSLLVQALAALAGLAGATVVAIATHRYGLNLSADGIGYLSGADRLADEGLAGLADYPTSLHPPGLSGALAPADALGLTTDAARWLNIVLLGVSAAGVGAYLTHWVRPPLAVAAAGIVGLGYPMVRVATSLASEPLYIALSLGHLALLAALLRTKRPTAVATGAGLVVAASILVRYSGASVLPVGIAVVALTAARGRRWRQLACYLLPVGLLVGGWLVRNLVVTGSPTGSRSSNVLGLGSVLGDGGATVAGWFADPALPSAVQVLVLVGVVAAVAATGVLLRDRLRAVDEPRTRLMALVAGYLLVSGAALVVMVATTNTDQMEDRLLSPLWPPLVVLLALAADLAVDRARVVAALALVPVVAAAVATTRSADDTDDGEFSGTGYNGPRWQSEQVRALTAAAPPSALMISNEPQGVRAVAGRSATESPRFTTYASTTRTPDSVAKFIRTAAGKEAYLLWIVVDERDGDADHVPPQTLVRDCTLEPVASTSAGTTYRILPRR